MSTVSSEEFANIGKRTRTPKQYKDFIVYGHNNQSLLASNEDTQKKINDDCVENVRTSDQVMDLDMDVPKTAQEALNSPEGDLWAQAMLDELNSFNTCNAWTLEKPEPDTKIVGNKWVFKKKIKSRWYSAPQGKACGQGLHLE